jgi:ribonuclease BN (tRNA processing enzyme)
MKITFLGTNGWYNYDNHETSCVLIEAKNFNLILDLGSGIKNLNKINLREKKTYLFLSHLHLDHIIGIHYLSSIKRLKDLKIIVNKKYLKFFEKIFNNPYTLKHSKHKNKIKIMTFSEVSKPKIPFDFIFKKLNHSDPSYGYKFFLDNKTVSYCTDTKYCENIFKLSKNSDLFILECNQMKIKNNFHLSFQEIKKNINKFNTKKIALTHFGPEDFTSVKDRFLKLKKKINSQKNIKFFITKDLDCIKL